MRIAIFGSDFPKGTAESATSIGAGDAYAATLIQSLAQGDAPEKALPRAAINAFMTTQKLDAQSGHQTQEQLQTLHEENPNEF